MDVAQFAKVLKQVDFPLPDWPTNMTPNLTLKVS